MTRILFETMVGILFLSATRVFADTCVSTVVGSGEKGFVDGPSLSAQFQTPEYVTTDKNGNLIVSDSINSCIRMVSGGVVTTVAGNGYFGMDNGDTMNASFYLPAGVVGDAVGNIYVADSGNNVVRRVSPSGLVTTVAGSGVAGFADGNATSAMFDGPTGLVMDSFGNIFVADTGNSLIRKLDSTGYVTTFAGSTPGSDDGVGQNASFTHPHGLAIDSYNNIYVVDSGNNLVRMVMPNGVVITVAGSLESGYMDGPASDAKFYNPTGIAIDANGTIYVTEYGNNLVRRIYNGVVSTVAGNGTIGLVDGLGSNAMFDGPTSVTIDAQGNLIVADTYNSVLRMISMNDCVSIRSTSTPTSILLAQSSTVSVIASSVSSTASVTTLTSTISSTSTSSASSSTTTTASVTSSPTIDSTTSSSVSATTVSTTLSSVSSSFDQIPTSTTTSSSTDTSINIDSDYVPYSTLFSGLWNIVTWLRPF